MKEFLISLYDNPSFPIYLGAVILVLVIAFFVVFFLGKKDKDNIEKTQRMEALKDNAFKENTVPVQMDVVPQVVTNEQIQSDLNNVVSETPVQSVQMPVVEQAPVIEQPVVAPAPVVEQAPVIEQPIVAPAPVVEQTPVIEQPIVAPEPVVEQAPVIEQPIVAPEPVVEQTPVIEQPVAQPEPMVNDDIIYPTMDNNYDTIDQRVDEQIDSLQSISNSISSELDALQEEQNKFYSMSSEPAPTPVVEQPVETPVVPEPVQPVIEEVQPVMEPVNNNYSTNNVFSSVYAPSREAQPVVTPEPVIEPAPVVEQPVVEPEPVQPAIDEDDEIELPKLK